MVWNIICKIDVNVTFRFLTFLFTLILPRRLSLIFSNPLFLHFLFPAPYFLFTLYLPNAIYHPFPFTLNQQGWRWRKKKKGFCITPPKKKKNFSHKYFLFAKTLFSSKAHTFSFFFLTLYFQHPLYSNNDNFLFWLQFRRTRRTLYILVGRYLPYVS